MERDISQENGSGLVRTGASVFEQWLTVADSAIFCQRRGLPRTLKTIRKWAARSHAHPQEADFLVRREDTENGYRWMIDRTTLERKVEEELQFEARQRNAPVRTTADVSEPSLDDNGASSLAALDENQPALVRTGEDGPARVAAQLERQLSDSREEVAFLREELRHRRKTDEALADVIEAFRLNAESNRLQLNDPGQNHRRLQVGDNRSEPSEPLDIE
jgi:hypothetical protein